MPGPSVNDAINLRLALLGFPMTGDADATAEAQLVAPILARQQEQLRRLADRLCAADGRIQAFLDSYLADCDTKPELPKRTLVLDQAGLARGISLPVDGDEFSSPLLSSYRLMNGVLHNPANDRRTTAGVFHIAEGGLPIPDDKLAVPKSVFAKLLALAFQPPQADLLLPYTANQPVPSHCWVSLMLRPLVVPGVPGQIAEKSMETRFIVPGGLVSNLDFVESIFGNGGDPYLPENDASLNPATWTGHTGAVILAPHLIRTRKVDLGLPHVDDATDRQKRDGMCWASEDELYNGGQAFKICARDQRGVIVTVIADNYYGYCKKEVKTQVSYSANLFGCAEEEHAGGALVFPAYNLGSEWTDRHTTLDYTVADVVARDPQRFALQPEGHALDLEQKHLVVVPGRSTFSLRSQTVSWTKPDGTAGKIRMLNEVTYLSPNGYRVHMKHRETDRTQWILIGTSPTSTECHKPATVSGGGKSEISKSLLDAFVYGNAYSADFERDMDTIQSLLDGDWTNRFADPDKCGVDTRPILSDKRSLGSVIKLMTPRSEYHAAHNDYLRSIPAYIKELLYTVKRYYKPVWGDDWRSHFSVGIMNGREGNAVRLDGEKIMVNMLRVGFDADGSWRLFSLRPDFSPAAKVQTEDDITASTVAPGPNGVSRKYVKNCERLLFQRPDDAIIRGYDEQTEKDMATTSTFISNFEPLTHADARAMAEDVVAFSQFTDPMADLVRASAAMPDEASPKYFAASSEPRLVNGAPSKNPRYLQVRPDLTNPEATAAADVASHLLRKLPLGQEAPLGVDIVAAGRRNNPPEDGVPPLCAYNPLHYMELPELFMEFISSMTGKSPSTTGAGSEGALTKAPFNAMPAVVDLNYSLLSYALTGYDGWLSSAGHIGPSVKVAHDISLLVPELFSRMWPGEREASILIEGGYLEKMTDFEHDGRMVLASRLGYRMNARFATTYFGRIFLHPDVVFTDDMLRPELQDADIFAESVDIIVTTHQRVAQAYFDDGTIGLACPPLRALLEIMAHGTTSEGYDLDSPEVRSLFERDTILASDWYAAMLDAKQDFDTARCEHAIAAMSKFVQTPGNDAPVARLDMPGRLRRAEKELARVSSPEYRQSLVGTVGRQVNFG
ncbi:MAG TPA: hypothetical protein PKN27_00435 [Propionibacteriaceae bacterium]|nr:hypothetical protein [Propionibacteriaceae bacterium]